MARSPSPSARLAQTRLALERHRDYLALLQAASEASNDADNLEEALAEVVPMICESLGWPIGHAMKVEPGPTLRASSGDIWELADPERYGAFRRETEALDELGVIQEAIERGEARVVDDIAESPDFRRRAIAAELGLGVAFMTPVLAGTQPVAVLEFFAHPTDEDKYEAPLMLLNSICNMAGRTAEREEAREQRILLLRTELAREHAESRSAELQRLTTELRRRNAELDQFAYVASHDLRAPLRGIANLASWLSKDLAPHLTDDTRRYLRLLEGRVGRMEALINGLLEYSRVGRREIPIESVDVRALVREVIDLLGAESLRGDVEWSIGELPQLRCRKLMLRQVFHNLMANALKYAKAESLRVEVGAERCEVDGEPYWRFHVRDNGVGIDPRYQERIWQIFQRLHSRDEIEGTGIGLSLVRKIVEHNGGEVALESTPGEGATFSFTWPSDPSQADTPTPGSKADEDPDDP